jgi:hypothetical protein
VSVLICEDYDSLGVFKGEEAGERWGYLEVKRGDLVVYT